MKAIACYQVERIYNDYYDCTNGTSFCVSGVDQVLGKSLKAGDRVFVYLTKKPGAKQVTMRRFIDEDMVKVLGVEGTGKYLDRDMVEEIFRNLPKVEEWNIWVRVVRS